MEGLHSRRSVTYQTSDGGSQSRQIEIDGIKVEGALTIRIMVTTLNNAKVCISSWRNSSRSGPLSSTFAQKACKRGDIKDNRPSPCIFDSPQGCH